jgi:hypothetical protein
VYVPGLSVTVRVFEPPLNVGVAPICVPPLPREIVKLWGTGEPFVNAIVTVPAFAASVVLSNFNAPVGSAASERLELAGAAGAAVVAGGVLALGVLVLLDPPPQPTNATPIATTATANGNILATATSLVRPLDPRQCLER